MDNKTVKVQNPMKCQACENEFTPKDRRSRFCGAKCRNRYHNELKHTQLAPRLCVVCGKEFTPKREGVEVCGLVCSNKNRPERPPSGVRITCARCGKDFWVPPSRAAKGEVKYCSNECALASPRKSRGRSVTITCESCGKVFVTPKSRADNGRKFCSQTCMLIGLKKARTKPEILAQSILDSLGIRNVAQHQVISGWFVDFLLPNDTILQIDGEYWHGHPRFEPLSETQLQQVRKDRRQDKAFESMGYKVVHLWADEVTLERVAEIAKSL